MKRQPRPVINGTAFILIIFTLALIFIAAARGCDNNRPSDTSAPSTHVTRLDSDTAAVTRQHRTRSKKSKDTAAGPPKTIPERSPLDEPLN